MSVDEQSSAEAPGWREIIRTERRRVGLTQKELARRAGLDAETIRKYENGARLPPRESLERILEVVQASDATIHRVLTDRGFFYPDFRYPPNKSPGYYFTNQELQPFVDQVHWPVFAANELGEVVVANRVVQRLWGIDLAEEVRLRGRARANMLVAMCEPRFASRLVNWDDILGRFIGLNKAVAASRTMLENPGVLFEEILAAIASSNPQALTRIYELWQTAPRIVDKVRWSYPVVWREPGHPDMRFQGVVTTASEPDGVGFNDWIPADAATWTTLEAVLDRRDGND